MSEKIIISDSEDEIEDMCTNQKFEMSDQIITISDSEDEMDYSTIPEFINYDDNIIVHKYESENLSRLTEFVKNFNPTSLPITTMFMELNQPSTSSTILVSAQTIPSAEIESPITQHSTSPVFYNNATTPNYHNGDILSGEIESPKFIPNPALTPEPIVQHPTSPEFYNPTTPDYYNSDVSSMRSLIINDVNEYIKLIDTNEETCKYKILNFY